MTRLRNMEPPVYNQRRLHELPIPETMVAHNDSSDESFHSFTENDQLSNSHEEIDNDANIELEINEVNDEGIMNHTDPLATMAPEHNQTSNEMQNISTESVANPTSASNSGLTNTILPENQQTSDHIRIVSVESLAGSTNTGGNVDNGGFDFPNATIPENPQTTDDIQVPPVESLDGSTNTSDNGDFGSPNANVPENESSNGILIAAVENLASSSSNANGMNKDENGMTNRNVATTGTNDPQNNAENVGLDSLTADGNLVVKREYAPLFNVHAANNAEIDDLLNESSEDEDALIMIVGPDGIPPPLEATEKKMIKRQNDKMSGNIPFNETVSFLF